MKTKYKNIFTAKAEDIENLVINQHIDINQINANGENALFNCNPEKAQALIYHGININYKDSRGYNAFAYNKYDTCKVLLNHGINLDNTKIRIFNIIPYNVATLLVEHLIKKFGCINKALSIENSDFLKRKNIFFQLNKTRTMEMLIKKGLNIQNLYFSDNFQKSYIIDLTKSQSKLKLLFKYKDKISHFNYVEEAIVELCDIPTLKIIIEHKLADTLIINSVDMNKSYIFNHYFKSIYDTSKLNFLFSMFDIKRENYENQLYLFNKHLNPDIINFWIEKGINLHNKDMTGYNALYSMRNNEQSALTLIEHGINPYEKNLLTGLCMIDVFEQEKCSFIDKIKETRSEYEKKQLTGIINEHYVSIQKNKRI